MNEERMEILKMVANKQITPEEGEALLNALHDGQSSARSGEQPRRDFPHPHEYRSRYGNDDEPGINTDYFEKAAEQFGNKIGRKMEKLGEKLERRMGNVFDDSQMDFEHDFPGWDFRQDDPTEDLVISGGKVDLEGVTGVILKSKKKSGSVDFSVGLSSDSFCRINGDAVSGAVVRGDWAVFTCTDSADISLPAAVRRVMVFTLNGDVEIAGLDAELSIKTLKGDVFIEGMQATARVVTLNGDIETGFLTSFSGETFLNTLKGDILCRVPQSLDLEFTGRTLSGDLHADGPGTVIKARYRRPANIFMTGTVGRGGANTLRMDSLKGDISVTSFDDTDTDDENARSIPITREDATETDSHEE